MTRRAIGHASGSTWLMPEEPRLPTQNVRPLCAEGTASSIFCMSESVDTTRGRPSIGQGGSSGCIARYTPASSATGTMQRRKWTRFSYNLCASIPRQSRKDGMAERITLSGAHGLKASERALLSGGAVLLVSATPAQDE
eukprot:scaffold80353_cov33-Tisochrysis_lutea.AAC.2